jgi:tetratricopeptide (TPR) repeat protein
MSARLFVSYRRSQSEPIDKLCKLLGEHDISVWLDRVDVREGDDFPEHTLQGLAGSHAVLVWWSLDYAESGFCLEELRLAWSMAREHPAGEGQRIWILNPENSSKHIRAGDLNAYSYLQLPQPENASAWVGSLAAKLHALSSFGPLSEKPVRAIHPEWYGRPPRGRVVGRGNELWEVHDAMFPQQIAGAVAPPLVQLHGIPGVGKSATAMHYADTFAAAYSGGVWWFNLAARGDIRNVEEAGLAWLWALEQALGLFHPGLLAELSRDGNNRALSPPLVRERIARHLSVGSERLPYLWVLEKFPLLEDEDVRQQVAQFLRAPTAVGRTLITSRDSKPLFGAKDISLKPLDATDGETLLGSYLAPAQREVQREVIADLVAEVGGHPLALILLGQRVRYSSSGLAPVLEEVRRGGALESLEDIWPWVRKSLGKLGPSVMAAIRVSLEPLDDDARRLLALAAVCSAHAPIPVRLLTQALDHVGSTAQAESGASTVQFDMAKGALLRASLMDEDLVDRQHLTVHPLVCAVTIKLLNRAPAAERSAVTKALLSRLSPLGADPLAFLAVRTDAPHASAVLTGRAAEPTSAVDGRETVLLALGLSRLQDALGHPTEALVAARHADALAAQHLPADDRDRLRVRTALSIALASVGLLVDAAALQEWLLPVATRVFGSTHEDALVLQSLLATTRYEQGRLKDAEQLLRALVDVLQRLPEQRYKALPAALHSLAATLHGQGRLTEARSVAENACGLILDEEARSGPHPDGVVAQHNIAAIKLSLGDVDAAIELQKEVLQKAEKLFGIDHPRTRLARSALADALVGRGSLELAIPHYRQALEQAAALLGDNHPECLVTMSRLILVHSALANRGQANELSERFIAAATPVLPAGHSDALAAVKGLSGQLQALGLPIGHLAPLLEQVVKAGLREKGISHVDTSRALADLLVARAQAGAPCPALIQRLAALDTARALHDDPVDRITALLVAHHEFISLLKNSGHTDAAAQAEVEAIAEFKTLRRLLPSA